MMIELETGILGSMFWNEETSNLDDVIEFLVTLRDEQPASVQNKIRLKTVSNWEGGYILHILRPATNEEIENDVIDCWHYSWVYD